MSARGPLLTLIAGLGVIVFALVLFTGSSSAYLVTAVFENAAGLRENNAVRIGGVTVGRVRNLEVDDDDLVHIELGLEKGAGPIGSGASAEIRSANLFGEKFVDLRPGQTDEPQPSGTVIPRARTALPVEVDEVLDVLNRRTRARLATLLTEAGRALAGRGRDLRDLIAALPLALEASNEVLDTFSRDTRALASLVRSSDQVLRAVAQERAGLGRLVSSARRAFRGFASPPGQLGATIESAAPALAQLRTSLAQVEQLSAPLPSAASALRRTAPRLAEVLDELPGFQDAARPALHAAADAAPDLHRLVHAASPTLAELRPTASELLGFARDFRPIAGLLDRSFGDTLGVLEGWARVVQTRDGLGHVFRDELVLTPGLVESVVGGPGGERRRNATAPNHRESAGRTSNERPRYDRSPEGGPPARPAKSVNTPTPDRDPIKPLLEFLFR